MAMGAWAVQHRSSVFGHVSLARVSDRVVAGGSPRHAGCHGPVREWVQVKSLCLVKPW